MADSREGFGKKKLVVRSERYRWKQVSYFECKYMAKAYAEFRYDIGNLVQRDCSAKFKSWKKVTFGKGCPKEFEDREDNWKKAKANKSNRHKKTLLHHSGSRPFSYRMEAQQRGVQNSQRSMSLATFMFKPGMSWPSPFIDKLGFIAQ
ncbi:hypothetical protein D8674_004650 [Pyrus ussuriensis x Pyrus communis]|uniref:Uncharacterized protein n=1 Tax=Pyrus ussuriensis x Pyrus communis TaxID=2448454 RepID=A0A5N5FKG4_9ROSA|nr:hypothetical protein D8674_004650 [Pyrus ussuriensis x Pyrus communis]